MFCKQLELACGFTALTALVTLVNAVVTDRYEWGFNLDGRNPLSALKAPVGASLLANNAGAPATVAFASKLASTPTQAIDASGFDFASSRGTIVITLNTVGGHAVDVYFDRWRRGEAC